MGRGQGNSLLFAMFQLEIMKRFHCFVFLLQDEPSHHEPSDLIILSFLIVMDEISHLIILVYFSGVLRSRSYQGESSSTRTISESSHLEQDECMIINSVELPPSIKNEQEECMAAFNDRFKLMQSKLTSPKVMLSPVDVNILGSCHVQSGSESESDPQTTQVQCVA